LFLELLSRRNDGFHELETIMASVSLFDHICLRRRRDDRIGLSRLPTAVRSSPDVFSMPQDRTNLVWQAVELLKATSGKKFGVDIAIRKHIPGQAGLGGGSSDAAATLLAANRLFDLRQPADQLRRIAGQLGSDVPFFLENGVAVCRGRGEQIRTLSGLPRMELVLAMPPQGLATAEVYRHSRVAAQPKSSAALLDAWRRGRLQQAGASLWNRLQSAAESLSPWIARFREEFARLTSLGHQMTGSGTAYFGLFASRRQAWRASRLLASRLPECLVVPLHSVGRHSHVVRYRVE
jgi:4-diphosphocytidyl-2-C-methyl-D-erythritol kinase